MATKDTVLEHLRALGYLDTSTNSLVSESFIRECVEELNADDNLETTFSHSHDYDALLVNDHLDGIRNADKIRPSEDEGSFDLSGLEESLGDEYDGFQDYNVSVEHEDSLSAFIGSLSNRRSRNTGDSPAKIEEAEEPSHYSRPQVPDPWSFSRSEAECDESQFDYSLNAEPSTIRPEKRPDPTVHDAEPNQQPLSIIQRLANLDLAAMQNRIISQRKSVLNSNKTLNEVRAENEAFLLRKEKPQSAKYTAAKRQPVIYDSFVDDTDVISTYSEVSSYLPPSKTFGCKHECFPTPVAKFHAHQQRWKKDEFLARRTAKPKPTLSRDHPVFQPDVGLNPSSIKPRHNLAAKRPSYVIPSEKSRRDVVWEVRTKLARAV
ncbi:hypothetical protein BDR26DRAFT_851168 [Obelidium mucronatum]|nr:hypothetical protein BDR26DRAFT_851168 [Obelidium mucronatum]